MPSSITWKEPKERARSHAAALYDSRILQDAAIRAGIFSALLWALVYTPAFLLLPEVTPPGQVEILIPLSVLAVVYAAPWLLLKLAPQGEYTIEVGGIHTSPKGLDRWSAFEGYRIIDYHPRAGSRDLILKSRSGYEICLPLPDGSAAQQIITRVQSYLPELPSGDQAAPPSAQLSNSFGLCLYAGMVIWAAVVALVGLSLFGRLPMELFFAAAFALGPGAVAAIWLYRRYSLDPKMCLSVAVVANMGAACLGGIMLVILLLHRLFELAG